MFSSGRILYGCGLILGNLGVFGLSTCPNKANKSPQFCTQIFWIYAEKTVDFCPVKFKLTHSGHPKFSVTGKIMQI
jgi:hypothetical protein